MTDYIDNLRRYTAATKKMQSGVAADDQRNDAANDGKHLRVGINTALTDHASLARLLIVKGVITEEDYVAALADGMEHEVKRIEETLSKRLGAKITLGEAGFGAPPK